MSLLWFFVYAAIIFIVIYYGGKQLIRTLIILNEYKLQSEAPTITWKFEDMLEIAKNKKDSELTDAEFHIKFGAYRHEVFRTSSITRQAYDTLGKIMHNIELYYIYHGPSSLNKKISIYKPIFIIGDFRSGTSVLERIIEHHPDICTFSTTHAHIWQSPKLFEDLVDWLDNFRIECGCEGWNSPKDKGMFYPHSSNNSLARNRPMECECIWMQCKSHLTKKRFYNWDNLDNKDKNPDNSTDMDILDYTFDDKQFETYLKNAIKMLLIHRNCKRFMWKNPLNGFRIGFLKKMFPDAKFIHIARNPVKTLKSQMSLESVWSKANYVDVDEFRRSSMEPRPPYYNSKENWYYMFHKQYPNDMYGHLWTPRVWPRTVPEYGDITKYIKNDKKSCATAVGIVQHERVVLEAFEAKENGINIGNNNLLTVWHEDVLDDPLNVLKQVHKFLELESNDNDRIKWLEMEDFPNGKANPKRVKQSKKWEKGLDFGDETDEVYKILTPAFERYEKHKQKTKLNTNK